MSFYRGLLALFLLTLLLVVPDGAAKAQSGSLINVVANDYAPCDNEPVIFTANWPDKGNHPTYLWKVNGQVQPSHTSNFTFPNNNPVISRTDVVSCTITNADNNLTKTGQTAGVQSYHNEVANVMIYWLGPSTICKGDALAVGSSIGYQSMDPNLHWQHTLQVNGVDVVTAVGPTELASFPPGYVVNNGDVIRAKVTFTGKCTVPNSAYSNELTVTVIDQPPAAVSINPASVDGCTGANLSFKATASNLSNVAFNWTVNGQPAGTNSDTFNTASLQNGDKVKCAVHGTRPCGALQAESDEVTVKLITGVVNNVSITSSAKDNIITAGQLVTFTAQTTITDGVTYQWQVNGINRGDNSPVFNASDIKLGDKVVCLVITPGSCPAGVPTISNQLTMLILEPVVPPNAFTPNGDGINDTWNIPALLAYPKCVVSIYNRYGAQIFSSVGYPVPWDGMANGAKVPVGTYYYVINLNYNNQTVAGAVTVVR